MVKNFKKIKIANIIFLMFSIITEDNYNTFEISKNDVNQAFNANNNK